MLETLLQEADVDYKMLEDSVWITIRNLSVNLVKHDEGLSIYVYGLGKEDQDSITETWAEWNEGAQE